MENYNELLKQKGIIVSGGTDDFKKRIYDIFKDLPYTNGLTIDFVGKDNMKWPDAFMETDLGEKRIRVNNEVTAGGRMASFWNVAFEENLIHEYVHSLPERPIKMFREIIERGGYIPITDYAKKTSGVKPELIAEEELAELLKMYIKSGNLFNAEIGKSPEKEKIMQMIGVFLGGGMGKTDENKGETMTDKLSDYDNVIINNLYSRRPDLQELFDDKGIIKNPLDKRVSGIKDRNDWFNKYGEEELYKHIGSYREDLNKIYDKSGNIISRESTLAKEAPTLKDWWRVWGKQEYADFLQKEEKNKVSSKNNLYDNNGVALDIYDNNGVLKENI